MTHSFIPTITLPTRITENAISLIDHIFIRVPHKYTVGNITAGVLYCNISDHLPVFCCIRCNTNKNAHNRPLIRLYNTCNMNSFINSIIEADMSKIYQSDDVNEAYDIFIRHIRTLHDKHFLLVKLSKCHKPFLVVALRFFV